MSLLLGLLTPPAPFTYQQLAYYPDYIQRARSLAHQQYVFQAMIDRTSPLADIRYPDRVDRPRPQQPMAFTMAPQPERTSPLADVRYPDRIERPKAQQQQAFATSPQPERTSPLADVRYPDRIERPKAQQQQAFAMGPSPIADVTYVTVLYPDWLPRRQAQHSAFFFSPQPEEKIQLDWQGSQPARLERRHVRIAELPFVFFDPKPEQPGAQALATFPASIPRVRPTPGWYTLDPKPEQTLALDWHAVYPDRLPRLTPQQQAFTTDPKPEAPVPSSYVYYPDRIDRREVRVADHIAFTFDPQPEAPIAYFNLIYPDRIDRPKVPPSQQPYFTTSPEPERTSPLADSIYPDRLPRLYPQHLSFALDPKPEETIQLDWQPRYPDHLPPRARVDGNFAFWPHPLPNPIPPTPPPPPKPVIPIVRSLGAGYGGHERIEFDWDTFWRRREKARLESEHRSKERAEREADYALLPLTGAIDVLALADGVVDTFLDEKGGLVVRLTADDGTVFYYAKVRSVREGRVRKGDSIGMSIGPVAAPKALPAATPNDADASSTPEPPPAVYGVLPIAPQQPAAAPPPRAVPSPQLPPIPLPGEALDPVRRPSSTQAIAIGAVIITLALGFAWLVQSMQTPERKKKKRRRRRKR